MSLCVIFFLVFVYLFIFSRGLVTRKIHVEPFIHRVDYMTANSKGLITQKSVIKIKSFNREHRKSSVEFMKSIYFIKRTLRLHLKSGRLIIKYGEKTPAVVWFVLVFSEKVRLKYCKII